jgi:tetratricopeptide (TPR) repeat protein
VKDCSIQGLLPLDGDTSKDAGMLLEDSSSLSALLATMSLAPLKDVTSFLSQISLLRSREPSRSRYISSDQYHKLSGNGSGSSKLSMMLNLCPDRPGLDVAALWSKPASPYNEICFFSSFEPSQSDPQFNKNAALTTIKTFQNTANGLQERFAKLRYQLPDTHPSLAKLYWEVSHYKLSEIWAKRVIEVNQKRGESGSPQDLLDQLYLIQAICEQGRLQEATELYQQLLPNINRNRSFVSPITAEYLAGESLRIQVSIAHHKGLFDDAASFSKQEVQFRLSTLGPYQEDTHSSMAMLALIMICLGNNTKALQVICLTLQLQERSIQSSHRSRCWSIMLLAIALRIQYRVKDSIVAAQRSEELSKNFLGIEHHDTLINKIEYGRCLRSAGLFVESEHAFRDALAGFTLLFGEDHVDTLIAMIELGGILMENGHWEEAAIWYEKAVAGLHNTEATHWARLDSCRNLGRCYEWQGRYTDAIAFYQETILRMELSNQSLANRERNFFFYFNSRLGDCYLREGRFIEAIRVCKDALREMRSLKLAHENWPYQREQFLDLSYKLAESYLGERQYYEASCVSKEALQAAQQPSENERYFDLVYVLAESYLGQGQHSEALHACKSAMHDLSYGEEHKQDNSHWKRRFSSIIADCYREQKLYEDARALFEQIVSQIHGSHLWTYQRCVYYTLRLIECYRELERNVDAVALHRRSVQEILAFGEKDCLLVLAQLEEYVGSVDEPSETERESVMDMEVLD